MTEDSCGCDATGIAEAATCSDLTLFSALFERKIDFVVGYFQRLGYSREDARDVAMETFLLIHREMERHRGASERAILAKVAKRVALKFLRHQEALKLGWAVKLSAPAAQGTAVNKFIGRDPRGREEQAQLNGFKSILVASIQDLPAACRIPLLMRISGDGYGEIAAALGLSEEAVKVAVRNARRRLRRELGQDYPGITRPDRREGGRK